MSDWSEVFSVQVDNAKWMIDRETNRIEGFHQRASYLLGFAEVILAILPTTLDPIATIKLDGLKWTAWSLIAIAALSLSAGALMSLLTIAVRRTLEVPVKGLQLAWLEWSNRLGNTDEAHVEPDTAQVLADFANALMGRASAADQSAILAIRAEGDVRARRLKVSVWCSTIGILALGALFFVLVASRIWP